MKQSSNRWLSCLLLLVSFALVLPFQIFAAKIELVMPQNLDQNQVFPMQVFLDTQGELTVGTDLLLSFDKRDLEFVQVDQANFYPNYHQAKIYLDKGHIRYSGTSNFRDYQQGSDLFATFFFRKKKLGKPQISLLWQKDRTDDTNVIGINGTDLLSTQPTIRYDDSLLIEPDPNNANNGKILGASSLDDFFFGGVGNIKTATPVSKSCGWWCWLWLIILLLLLFFWWRRKKRK